jgi:hypothetical protein
MSHVVTILIGSGVLAMAWSFAQLGWVGSPVVLVFFFGLTYYTSTLLADCYRHPDPVTGAINKEYIEAVGCYLGMKHQIANLIVIIIIHHICHTNHICEISIAGQRSVFWCGFVQYINIWATLLGYTITASDSMR